MTAIHPAKLKIQTTKLSELMDQPKQFVHQLHELMEFYSARIRQTNLRNTPLALQTYQAPPPVMGALEGELAFQLQENPAPGYSLADTLWGEHWVECRQLAVFILGILPPDQPAQILDRVQDWLEDCTSENIRSLIITDGLHRLSIEKPQRFLEFIQQLIDSGSKNNHQAALFGLGKFAEDPNFPNLPRLYRHLGQILKTEESGLIKEISALVQKLAARSEQETAYFLMQQVQSTPNPRIFRVVRGAMPHLSPTYQRLLKEKLDDKK